MGEVSDIPTDQRSGEDLDKARQAVIEQLQRMEQRGTNEWGYVQRFGDSNAPADQRDGDGGQAIFAADKRELDNRKMAFDQLLLDRPRLPGECRHGMPRESCVFPSDLPH